ncbi:MAG: hypothetical protein HIU85_20420 [Proteobacteria bacterium]|nr:hypothetical protein [Pseudomonadota bacterium]
MDRARLDALTARYLNATLDDAEVRLAEHLPETSEDANEVWQGQVIEKIESTELALATGDYSTTVETARATLPGGSETALAVRSPIPVDFLWIIHPVGSAAFIQTAGTLDHAEASHLELPIHQSARLGAAGAHHLQRRGHDLGVSSEFSGIQ